MSESLLFRIAAFGSSLYGMTWLALAMATHWARVRGDKASAIRRGQALFLRVGGVLAQLLALVLFTNADHLSIAAVLWIMTMTTTALIVAATLAYRPSWLALLIGQRRR